MTARKKSARKAASRAAQTKEDKRQQHERETTPNHPDNVTQVRVQPVDGNTVRATS